MLRAHAYLYIASQLEGVPFFVLLSSVCVFFFLSVELSFSGGGPYSDLHIGREMCGIVALIDRRTAALAMFQQHLLKLRHRLRSATFISLLFSRDLHLLHLLFILFFLFFL